MNFTKTRAATICFTSCWPQKILILDSPRLLYLLGSCQMQLYKMRGVKWCYISWSAPVTRVAMPSEPPSQPPKGLVFPRPEPPPDRLTIQQLPKLIKQSLRILHNGILKWMAEAGRSPRLVPTQHIFWCRDSLCWSQLAGDSCGLSQFVLDLQ